jgi:hypothetical protein
LIVGESLVNDVQARQICGSPMSASKPSRRSCAFTFPRRAVISARGRTLQAHRPARHDADLLQARGIPRAFQRRRSRYRHPQPFGPVEIGYYIPATTEKTTPRCVKVDGNDRCKIAIQTNNVEVDDRGYIYIVDRASTGLHILTLKASEENRKLSSRAKLSNAVLAE